MSTSDREGLCRHDLPAGQCAMCASRPPVARRLVLITDPTSGEVYLHAADCWHVHRDRNPWPRREVTEAEAKAARWPRCLVCQP